MKSPITSRKHPSVLRPAASAALAMMLPFAAQAADGAAVAADEGRAPQRVHVHGERENDFKAAQAASDKYTQPLLDTPQTVVVIKKELIEQQGAVTLAEALRNTPGVGTFFLGENGNTNTGIAVSASRTSVSGNSGTGNQTGVGLDGASGSAEFIARSAASIVSSAPL